MKNLLLLIDDDPFSLRMLEDFFRNEWKVINETVPESIIQRITSEKPNLVLLNGILRRTDGEVIFHEIHKHFPELPVVVMVPSNQAKIGRKLLQNGAFWSLVLPLNSEDLKHVMNIALELERARERVAETNRDFVRLEEGIARMSTPIEHNLPSQFTFEQDELVQGVIDLLADILEVEILSLMLLDKNGEMRIKAAKGLSPYVIENTVRKVGEGIAGAVARDGKPLFIENVDKDPNFSESPFYHHYSTKSLISVPLKAGRRVVGVLSANNKISGQAFNQQDLYIATIFSHLLLLTLQNAQLHFDRERMFMRESRLSGLNRKLSATLEPNALFRILLLECHAIFEVDSAFLFIVEEKATEWSVCFIDKGKLESKTLSSNLMRSWLAQRHEASIKSGPDHEEYKLLNGFLNREIRSWLSVPIVLQDKLTGSLELASGELKKFKEADKKALIRIGEQASLTINNARLYTKLLDSLKEITAARKEVEKMRRGQFL